MRVQVCARLNLTPQARSPQYTLMEDGFHLNKKDRRVEEEETGLFFCFSFIYNVEIVRNFLHRSSALNFRAEK